MSLAELNGALDSALNAGRVRRKANRTGLLRAKAARVAKHSPEVMVKITGFGKGSAHVGSHLRYISRNGKVELETDRGEVLEGKAEVKKLFEQWAGDFDDAPRRKSQRDTMHMVLSMPEGTPPEAVREGIRSFARQTFGKNHEYVFALHTDEPHPHAHITVKMLGFDGKRLNPRKGDLQAWRERFAQAMREQGVDAEATPRPVRGVVRKPERAVIRHIERGDERRPPRTSRVQAARVKEAANELSAEVNGAVLLAGPWEARIKATQAATRYAWLAAAAALEQNGTPTQEQANERPRYASLDAGRVRAGQRAAALYQSHLEQDGGKAPAAAIARMRDLSRLDVVQHQRPAQVLLHTDAFDRVGRHGTADYELRRPRASAPGAGEHGRPIKADGDGRLAGRIRAFVESMPTIATTRHALKRQLAARFAVEIEPQSNRGLENESAKLAKDSSAEPKY